MPADSRGFTYEQLLELQQRDIEMWRHRLIMPIFIPLRLYVLNHNRPAKDTTESHKVWRGQDIVEIIKHWPKAAPCFPDPQEKEGSDLI